MASELPLDLTEGDLVVVSGTGAYHHQDDTRCSRPPVLGIADGLVRTLVRRESLAGRLQHTA